VDKGTTPRPERAATSTLVKAQDLNGFSSLGQKKKKKKKKKKKMTRDDCAWSEEVASPEKTHSTAVDVAVQEGKPPGMLNNVMPFEKGR